MNDKDKRIERLEATLRTVDRHMSGNDNYEGIWVNYPDKPEQSPASIVREALDGEGSDGDSGMEVDVHEVVAWAALIDSLEGAAGGSPGERAIMIAHAILEADSDEKDRPVYNHETLFHFPESDQRGEPVDEKGDPLCEADDESGEQPCVEKSHALERASRIATDTPTDDGAGGDMLSETIQRAKDNTLNRDAREAAVKAAHFQYFMNKAPFEEAVKTALRTADVLLPAEPAPPTVPETVRRLAEEMRHQYFNHNNGAADARLLEWAGRLLNAYDPATPEQWEEGMPHRDDPPSPPAPDHWEESGWVIEHADSEVCEPMYWTGSQDEPWSADHEKALRFARERDAGVMAIHALAGTGVRIAEHAWDRFANELDRALAQHSEPENEDAGNT